MARPEGLDLSRPPGSLRARAELEETKAQQELLAALAPAWDDFIQSAEAV